MVFYIWEFRVEPDREEAFRSAYGPEGEWVRLFRRDPGYLGTELGCDVLDPRRFVTIDRWRSRADLVAFRERWADEIQALDQRCEQLTRGERPCGDFELVG